MMGGPQMSRIITDPDSTCFIDSSYIGGDAYYTINTRVITNNQLTKGNSLKMEEPVPVLDFENTGIDSLRISCNRSKYKCIYTLTRIDTYPHVTILSSSSDTACTIEHPGFGKRSQFSLVTSPFSITETNSQYSKTDFKYHVLGKNIAGNWPKYGYNHIDKVILPNLSKMKKEI